MERGIGGSSDFRKGESEIVGWLRRSEGMIRVSRIALDAFICV